MPAPTTLPPGWRVDAQGYWVDPRGPWRMDPSTKRYIEGPAAGAPPGITPYFWTPEEKAAIERAQNAGVTDYVTDKAGLRQDLAEGRYSGQGALDNLQTSAKAVVKDVVTDPFAWAAVAARVLVPAAGALPFVGYAGWRLWRWAGRKEK